MKKLFAAIGFALLLTSVGSSAGARDLYVRSAYVADISVGAHLIEGQVTIISDTVLYVEHFTYDGGAPAVYFYLGAENTDSAFQNGLQLMPLLDRAYADETLVLELPPGETLDGYQAISVWCVQFSVNFSSAEFVAPLGYPYPRAGWEAGFPLMAHDVQGTVTIVNDRLLFVEHFSYDGLAPLVYFYLGAENTDLAFQNGLQVAPELDRRYSDEYLVLALPGTEVMDAYQAISVWCVQFSANFSSDEFTEPVNVPATGPLGLLLLMVALPIAMRLRR
jgi:hypothetical protein